MKNFEIDLITLDLGLGGEDGLAIARQVREQSNIPIVIVSGKSDDVDRIVGLELGADDYIVKPFNIREVLARIRAVLRRYTFQQNEPSREGDLVRFCDWEFNIAARELHNPSGNLVTLTTGEFELLAAFVQRPGRTLSREQLLDLLKGDQAATFDRAIDTLVGRLRKKIEPDPDVPTFIKTVRGAGYVFSATVTK